MLGFYFLPWWVTINRCSSWILFPFTSLCNTWPERILSSWGLKRRNVFDTDVKLSKVNFQLRLAPISYLQILSIQDSSFIGLVIPGLRCIVFFRAGKLVFEQPAVLERRLLRKEKTKTKSILTLVKLTRRTNAFSQRKDIHSWRFKEKTQRW